MGDQTPGAKPWGERLFEDGETVRRLLETKLGAAHLAKRSGGGNMTYAFVESWKAIELANSIFGFDGWSSTVRKLDVDFHEVSKNGKYRVGVSSIVQVKLKDGTVHEDVGFGCAENLNKGTAFENAKKEAVSDARKRALRLFGHALGNSIYDKDHIKTTNKVNIKASATAYVSYDLLHSENGFKQLSDPDPALTADKVGVATTYRSAKEEKALSSSLASAPPSSTPSMKSPIEPKILCAATSSIVSRSEVSIKVEPHQVAETPITSAPIPTSPPKDHASLSDVNQPTSPRVSPVKSTAQVFFPPDLTELSAVRQETTPVKSPPLAGSNRPATLPPRRFSQAMPFTPITNSATVASPLSVDPEPIPPQDPWKAKREEALRRREKARQAKKRSSNAAQHPGEPAHKRIRHDDSSSTTSPEMVRNPSSG